MVTECLSPAMAPPNSLEMDRPVWGLDPSSKRVAVACVQRGLEWVETVSLPKGWDDVRRFGEAHEVLVPFLRGLPVRPGVVFVEEPFLPRDHRQQPTHVWMFGVVLAALTAALGPEPKFRLIGASTWKAKALGAGHGRAKKPEVMEWARNVAGYAGSIEDEADAIGVATGGAVLLD